MIDILTESRDQRVADVVESSDFEPDTHYPVPDPGNEYPVFRHYRVKCRQILARICFCSSVSHSIVKRLRLYKIRLSISGSIAVYFLTCLACYIKPFLRHLHAIAFSVYLFTC